MEGVFLRRDRARDLGVLRDGGAGAGVFELWGRRGEAVDLRFGEFGGRVVGGCAVDGEFDGGGAGVDGEDDLGHFEE